jgi:hydrogenase/urease accessory protein HupE
MTLSDWEQRNKWLVAHRTSKNEIAEIVAVGDRDLSDSRVAGLSVDSRLMHAYSAGLEFATAALAAAGYRPARGMSTTAERTIISPTSSFA